MIIEEKDFRLIPISDSSPQFNLELLYKIQPKGKEAKFEFKNVAYGISLETAIKKIAHYRVCQRHEEESVVLLIEYLKELKAEIKSLEDLCIV